MTFTIPLIVPQTTSDFVFLTIGSFIACLLLIIFTSKTQGEARRMAIFIAVISVVIFLIVLRFGT